MPQQPQKPEKEFRAGTVKVAIWRNETEQDSRTVVQHSVRLQKRYRDQSGEWKDSDYLFANDLPRARLVIDKAYEYIVLKESDDQEGETEGV